MGESYKDIVNSIPRHPNVPEGVGPHEGIELELMLAGTKPAAMFYGAIPWEEHCIPENEFDPYVDNGRFVKKVVTYPELFKTRLPVDHVRYVFYALISEAWRVDELERIQNEIHEYVRLNINNRKIEDFEPTDIAIGHLLGYTEEQIQIFLKHQKRHLLSE